MLDLNKTYKHLDIRAEVLIAELEDRTDIFVDKNIVISPEGDFNKSLRYDISKIDFLEYDLDEDVYQIHVVRKGLYDALPTGLFHDSTSRTTSNSKSAKALIALEDIKQRRAQEKAARTFFAPFDQAFNHYRLLLENEERRVLTGFPVGSRHTLFDIIWGGFGNQMSNDQKSALFSILPIAHNITGDAEFTGLAFTAILGFTTTIATESQISSTIPATSFNILGNGFLAQDTILGACTEERELIYNINISQIPTTKIIDFLPQGKTRNVVDILCGFFLPAELSYRCNYDFDRHSLILDTSSTVNVNLNRLGYGITI